MEESPETKITELFSNHLGIEKNGLNPSMDLQKDLNLSALEVADFITILENTFHIEIPGEESKKWTTIADIINSVADHGNFT